MGSISQPSGPSISGYTRLSINNDISTSEGAYKSAKENFAKTRSQFFTDVENTNSKRQTLNSALQNLQSAESIKNSAYDTMNSALSYLNSLSKDDPRYAAAKTAADKATAAYTSATGTYNTAVGNYNKAQSEFNASVQKLDVSRANYQSASTTAYNASIAYGNALARSQILTDQESSTVISNAIWNLQSNLIPSESDLKGLTLSAYEDLKGKENNKNSARDALIASFHQYRYIAASIANTWTEIFKHEANQKYAAATGQAYDSTYLNSLFANLETLKSLQNQASSILENGLYQYSSSYQIIDQTLLNIISAARSQAENWSSYLTAKKNEASAQLTAYLNEQSSKENEVKNDHYSENPTENSAYTNSLLSSVNSKYITSSTQLLSSGSGVNISSSSTPQLPPGRNILSIGQLMDIIAKVQTMMRELSQLMSKADRRINSFRREVNQNEVSHFLSNRLALDDWSRQVYSSDMLYNADLERHNATEIARLTNIYKTYQNNLSVVNGVIDQINAEISANNAKNKALVDTANGLNAEIVKTINESYKNRADTRNVLDYQDFETDITKPSELTVRKPLSYPPDIPTYPHISPLPNPPKADYNQNPPVIPTDEEIASFNTTVENLARQIAPFASRVQKTLLATVFPESKDDPSLLTLQKLYLREEIEARDSMLKSNYDGFFSFISSFTRQLSAMNRADQDSDNSDHNSSFSLRNIGLFQKKIESSNPVKSESTSTSTTVGSGINFSQADSQVKPSAVAELINQITESDILHRMLYQLFNRIGIQAGLQAIGSPSSESKAISSMGIPLSEISEDEELNPIARLDKETGQLVAFQLIHNIGHAAQDIETLKNSAVEMLQEIRSTPKISDEEMQDAIKALIELQQILLLLLASFLGASSGIPSDIFSASLRADPFEQELIAAGRKNGIPTDTMQAITEAIGSEKGKNLVGLFSQLGIRTEEQLSLLILIGAKDANISLTDGVPGGKAFLLALFQQLPGYGFTNNSINLNSPLFGSSLEQALYNKSLKTSSGISLDAIQSTLSGNTNILDDFSEKGIFIQDVDSFMIPDTILQQLVQQYATLPSEVQNKVEEMSASSLSLIQDLTLQEKSALLSSVATGNISSKDATALLTLLSQKGSKDSFSYDAIDKILQNEDIQQKEKRPSTLPKEITEVLRSTFTLAGKAFEDFDATYDFSKSFTHQKLTNFNKIAVDYLLDPAKVILREFSIITRSSADKMKQSPIILGG